jgi:hypothetical protein
MLKKLLISPFFGKLPDWFDLYKEKCRVLKSYGWEFLVVTDLKDFSHRIKKKLGVEPNIIEGTCKASDFRPALGLLYQDKLKGCDFWGHTDLDCVYGRLDKFITDELLSHCDIYSNDLGHMCGPMSLYRNADSINHLFTLHPDWRGILENPIHQAFDEQGISEIVNQCTDLKVEYHHFEGHDPNVTSNLSYKDGSLYDDGEEIMYFHFNRSKVWPL